jgi:hypothetical protein
MGMALVRRSSRFHCWVGGVGVAVGEGVEAGAEEDVLGYTVGYGVREIVLCIAAAGDQEGPEGDGEGLVELGYGLM